MFGFLKPRPITVTTNFTSGEGFNRPPRNDKFELVDGPPVTFVSDRALLDGIFRPGDFGYLLVERPWESRGAIYAWPLPLWALLRLRVELRNLLYRTIRTLYQHKIVTTHVPEGCEVRLRDLRLSWPWR
jgi:hypothetical protein